MLYILYIYMLYIYILYICYIYISTLNSRYWMNLGLWNSTPSGNHLPGEAWVSTIQTYGGSSVFPEAIAENRW